MTCCVIALALAWQMINGWRWVKRRLGVATPERTSPRTLGVMAANLVDGLRRPGWLIVILAVVFVEAGAAGSYVYEHRFHIGNEVQALMFNSTGFALDMCRSLGIIRENS